MAQPQLPELPEGLDPLELEAEVESRVRAHEAEVSAARAAKCTRGGALLVCPPPAQPARPAGQTVSQGSHQTFASLAGSMYKATAKWLESPHLPEAARVDTAVRVQVIFRFMAGLLLRYFSDDAVDIFEEVLYWLLDPEIGLQDAIKEWHAECKQNHGKDMSSDTRKKLQTAQTALLESLRHIAAAVFVQMPPSEADEHFCHLGDISHLEAVLSRSKLCEADVPPALLGPALPLQLSVRSCTALLAELRAAYAQPDFQTQYMQLRNSPSAQGQHVEFTLQTQSVIIAKYGFEPSLRGVMEMRFQSRVLVFDVVILKLLTDIHGLLEAQKPLPKRVPWHFQRGWRPASVSCGVGPWAQLVQTCWDTGDRLELKEPLQLEDDFPFSGPQLEIDLLQPHQEILGFGGAFTEASALVFQGLHPSLQKELLDLYFGKEGIGFSVGRVHINSCDFSLGNYCFAAVEDDFQLQHFDHHVSRDTKALIPFIRCAAELVVSTGRSLRLIASPWSPPGWMKTSGVMNGSEKPGLRSECGDAWARYIASWIAAYKQHGVPVWAVTVQNEPEHSAPWEACCYDARGEAEFVAAHLGPTLQCTHPEVGIFIYDHNKDHVFEWACATLSNQTARQFVQGVAFHWYAGDHFSNVQRTRETFPDLALLSTEACYERHRWRAGTDVAEGDWSFGEGYAHDIMGNLNAGASGWIDWNLLLDEAGGPNHVGNVCDAPMLASTSHQNLFVHPQFFFFGHFSKYIAPGSRRLETSVSGTPCWQGANRSYGTCTAQDGLQGIAFRRPDGILAAVVLNASNLFVNFKLRAGERALRASIPARSIQTYLMHEAAL